MVLRRRGFETRGLLHPHRRSFSGLHAPGRPSFPRVYMGARRRSEPRIEPKEIAAPWTQYNRKRLTPPRPYRATRKVGGGVRRLYSHAGTGCSNRTPGVCRVEAGAAGPNPGTVRHRRPTVLLRSTGCCSQSSQRLEQRNQAPAEAGPSPMMNGGRFTPAASRVHVVGLRPPLTLPSVLHPVAETLEVALEISRHFWSVPGTFGASLGGPCSVGDQLLKRYSPSSSLNRSLTSSAKSGCSWSNGSDSTMAWATFFASPSSAMSPSSDSDARRRSL